MRTARLISLLLHLQIRGTVSGRELAETMEVSERTLQRDIATLSGVGIPIISTRGPGGGYRMDDGYRGRMVGLDPDEAATLALLGMPGVASALELSEQQERARHKLFGSLTTDARTGAERVNERFVLDTARWFGTPEPTPFLPQVASAVFEDRRIRIRYSRSGRETRRTLDPLGLVLAAGDWYLVARHSRGDRTYRISRIRSVAPLDQRVVRPEGFQLAAVWKERRREMETRRTVTEVKLRIEPAALPQLRRAVAVVGQAGIDPSAVGEPLELTVPFDSFSWAQTVLLGLGASVTVLEPSSLREVIVAEVEAMRSRYAL